MLSRIELSSVSYCRTRLNLPILMTTHGVNRDLAMSNTSVKTLFPLYTVVC